MASCIKYAYVYLVCGSAEYYGDYSNMGWEWNDSLSIDLHFLISNFSAKKTKKGGWREVIGLVRPLCL
jgi:hypothetical protein